MKKTLWSKNFTIITLGTVISAIGDTAMGFALSFVVFDTTGSTLLSALFTAVSSCRYWFPPTSTTSGASR